MNTISFSENETARFNRAVFADDTWLAMTEARRLISKQVNSGPSFTDRYVLQQALAILDISLRDKSQ